MRCVPSGEMCLELACAALLALARCRRSRQQRRGSRISQIRRPGRRISARLRLVVAASGHRQNAQQIPLNKQSCGDARADGRNIRGATIRTGNVAAVWWTGQFAAFATRARGWDVTVFLGGVGAAKKPEGRTLARHPLLGATANVYAVAQGSLAIWASRPRRSRQDRPRRAQRSAEIRNGAITNARSSSR